MAMVESTLVRVDFVQTGCEAFRCHGLNLRIPVEYHLIFLEIIGRGLVCGVGGRQRWNWPQSTKCVPTSGTDTVDYWLETDSLQRVLTQFPADRQHHLERLLVGRETLLLQILAELCHVVGPNTEDVKRLEGGDVWGRVQPIGQFDLAAAFQA